MNWGYRIILAFILFIGFIAFLVFRVLDQEWHLVSRDYYEQEIRYQEQINQKKNTRKLSAKIRIEYSKKSGQAIIKFPHELNGRILTGNVHFFRPSNANLDKILELNIDKSGQQVFDLSGFKNGLWKVKVFFKVGNTDYFDELDLYL